MTRTKRFISTSPLKFYRSPQGQAQRIKIKPRVSKHAGAKRRAK